MDAIVERVCGLDVHQASVVACVLIGAPGKKPAKEVRSFGTFTRDLLSLRDWLRDAGCTHVGMESTGVFWKPVYAVLEGDFELIVGNAHHMKNVPGRKTDVKDSEWIADLVRHGLVAKSFVPPKPIRELREVMRYRRKLVESRTTERNRVLKLLEAANIKLSSVAADPFGTSGMRMLTALADGDETPEAMADMALRRMRRKVTLLTGALDGRMGQHQRFLLSISLGRLKRADADIAKVDKYIDRQLRPFREKQAALVQIPGIGQQTAATIISEVGVDMTVFHSAHHLAAWAGLCPGNNESAGKQLGGHARKGNTHLRTALVEVAQAAIRKKGSYFRAKYFRLKARRGSKRAIFAIAHKLLIATYHVLARNAPYAELGDAYLDTRDRRRSAKHLVRRLELLGFVVTLGTPAELRTEEVPGPA